MVSIGRRAKKKIERMAAGEIEKKDEPLQDLLGVAVSLVSGELPDDDALVCVYPKKRQSTR
jgi:hypothetical protein